MQRIWSRTRKARLPGDQLVSNPPIDADVLGPSFSWKTRADDQGKFYLYKADVQIGGWDDEAKQWRSFDSGKWSAPATPPWEVAVKNFGVATERLRSDNTYSYCGKKVDWKSIQAIFGDDRLEDDSKKLRLTVIGGKEECDRVLTDLKTHPKLSEFSNRFAVQSYRPGTWPTEVYRDAGKGPFYLSVQLPADSRGRGKELHSQKAYDGPDSLAIALAEAVRRADPNYDPSKTPDLRKPPAPPPAPPAPNPPSAPDGSWVLWAIGIFLALLLLKR